MTIPRNTNLIFEEIKGAMRDIDNLVGAPVTNLHGIVATADVDVAANQRQQWYFISTDAVNEMPSLTDFINAVSLERPGYDIVPRIGNSTRITPTLEDQTKAHMLLTSLRILGPTRYPVEVDAPGYEIAIYLDTQRMAVGREYLKVDETLAAGNRIMSIVLFGGTGPIAVTTSEKLGGTIALPRPEAPYWAATPYSTYVDPQAGTLVNRLRWANDAFAGSWIVYKSNAYNLLVPDDVVDNSDGTFTLEYDTADYPAVEGTILYARDWDAGIITDVVKTTSPSTYITVAVSDNADQTAANWTTETFFIPQDYFAVATLGFPGTSVLQWDDLDVVNDNMYFYKVTALDFLDGRAESRFSPEAAVLGGDTTPPGAITVTSTILDRNVVRISFTAPSDEDYVGVKVYGPYDSDTGVSINNPPNDINDDLFEDVDMIKIEYGKPNRSDQVYFTVTDIGDYYITPFDAIDNERDPTGAHKYTFDNGDLLAPSHVTDLTSALDTADPNNVGVFPRIILTWTEPVEERFGWAEVQLNIDSGPWLSVGTGDDGRFEFDGYWDAEHEFRVISVNIFDPTIKAAVGTAPTTLIGSPDTDSANSEFMGRFTETEQWADNTPPDGYFTVRMDMDDDDVDEVMTLTTIGTLSYP